MIPDKIRTGFDSTEYLAADPQQQDLQTRLVSLVVLMVEYSLTNAMTYSLHHGIEEVDDAVMKLALQVEAMRFFERDNLETDLGDVIDSITYMSDDEHDEGEDDSEHDASGVDDAPDSVNVDGDTASGGARLQESIEVPEDAIPPRVDGGDGTCHCDTCLRFRTIVIDWDAWDVESDPIKSFLKMHIDRLGDVAPGRGDDSLSP